MPSVRLSRPSPSALRALALATAVLLGACAAHAPAPLPAAPATPAGEVKGDAFRHTDASARAAIAQASLALPSSVTGGQPWIGRADAAPQAVPGARPVPVVVFLHGSSGLGLKAIGEWQAWLATQGIASLAPDSMALPGRLQYKSPVDKATYEKIHALRAQEAQLARAALRGMAWADPARLVLAGTSEGAVAVAREPAGWAGRMIFSWSCEDNYFVEAHRTATGPEPVLNVIGSTDPYFSTANTWLGAAVGSAPQGHCARAFAAHPAATIVLLPGAPHTLLNLPQARQAVRGWLQDLPARP